jgi:predicted NUDIX family NTP pyrophosphohydrolase
MAEYSAGILLYRRRAGAIEVLLIHPGGPYWRNKDAGAWMIPKGGVEKGEEPLAAALREFEEEIGTRLQGTPRPLCRIRQKGGKWVEAYALEGDLDADAFVSNQFQIEVPARSGNFRSYPEVDRAAWMPLPKARAMILPSQSPILDALEDALAAE